MEVVKSMSISGTCVGCLGLFQNPCHVFTQRGHGVLFSNRRQILIKNTSSVGIILFVHLSPLAKVPAAFRHCSVASMTNHRLVTLSFIEWRQVKLMPHPTLNKAHPYEAGFVAVHFDVSYMLSLIIEI